MQHIAFPYYGNYNINKKSNREDKAMTCQIDLYAGLLGCGKTTLIKKIDGKLVLIGKKLDMVWLKEQLRNL